MDEREVERFENPDEPLDETAYGGPDGRPAHRGQHETPRQKSEDELDEHGKDHPYHVEETDPQADPAEADTGHGGAPD